MIEVKVFAEGVAKQIKEYLPKEYQNVECRVSTEGKNNGSLCPGITFQMPGNSMVPVVYIEPFYEEVRMGKSLEAVMKEIAKDITASMPDKLFPDEFDVESFDCVKEYLGIQLINTRANKVMLLDHPHRGIEDLSVLCTIEVPEIRNNKRLSMKVTNGLAAKWGIGTAEVFRKAEANSREKHPPILIEVDQAIWWREGSTPTPENLLEAEQVPDEDCSLYILKGRNQEYGAVAMLYPEVLNKMCELFPGGYYILPTSTHEVAIFPKGTVFSIEELRELVRDGNRYQLKKEEVLSDHIYEYDKDRGRIFQVPEPLEKERGTER